MVRTRVTRMILRGMEIPTACFLASELPGYIGEVWRLTNILGNPVEVYLVGEFNDIYTED
jgi:hypothetical protein